MAKCKKCTDDCKYYDSVNDMCAKPQIDDFDWKYKNNTEIEIAMDNGCYECATPLTEKEQIRFCII